MKHLELFIYSLMIRNCQAFLYQQIALQWNLVHKKIIQLNLQQIIVAGKLVMDQVIIGL